MRFGRGKGEHASRDAYRADRGLALVVLGLNWAVPPEVMERDHGEILGGGGALLHVNTFPYHV